MSAIANAIAPAMFLGFQPRPGGKPPIELWNLTEEIPGHSAGSTVSRETLERAGFRLPGSDESEKAVKS